MILTECDGIAENFFVRHFRPLGSREPRICFGDNLHRDKGDHDDQQIRARPQESFEELSTRREALFLVVL